MGLWQTLFSENTPGITAIDGATFSELLSGSDIYKIPTVVAGRQLIADTVSSFPMEAVYPDGTKLEPNRTLLARPSPREPASDTFERIVNSMTRHGIAWLRITLRGSDGYPSALEHIDNGRVTYSTDQQQTQFMSIDIDGIRQDMRDIKYVPMVLDGTCIPKAPLDQIRDNLEDLIQAYQFSNQYYTFTGSVPPFAIKSDVKLAAGQAEKLADAWAAARDKHRPAILSGGLEIETYNPVSAKDALVLDAIGYWDLVIGRILNIPPSLLNVQSATTLTYSTTLDEFRRFLAIGLNTSYLHRIESVFSDMVPPQMVARFDTSGLTRMDEASQAGLNISLLDAGILTVDEIRQSMSLQPLPQEGGSLPRELSEIIQKIYLGVGTVVTDTEARQVLSAAGMPVSGPLPTKETPDVRSDA